MARGELLTQLAMAPPWQRALLAVLILVMVGGGYKYLVHGGLGQEKGQLEHRQRSLLDKQRKLDQELEDFERLTQQKEELERSIRDNQRALPTEAELPAFFDHLQRKAGDAGVTIRRWERRDEQGIGAFVRVPVYMEVGGTFHGIMRYFALLGPQRGLAGVEAAGAGARIDERLVSIESLQLGDPKAVDGEIHLTARFLASTFRQPPPDEADARGRKDRAR